MIQDVWMRLRVTFMKEKFPELRDVPWSFTRALFLEKLMIVLKTDPVSLEEQIPASLKSSIHETSGLGLEDVSRWVTKTKRPVVIFSSVNDPLVPPELNSLALKKNIREQKEIGFVHRNNGFHCSFPVSTDWNFLKAVLASSISGSIPSEN